MSGMLQGEGKLFSGDESAFEEYFTNPGFLGVIVFGVGHAEPLWILRRETVAHNAREEYRAGKEIAAAGNGEVILTVENPDVKKDPLL